jgi:hypothetical protein
MSFYYYDRDVPVFEYYIKMEDGSMKQFLHRDNTLKIQEVSNG